MSRYTANGVLVRLHYQKLGQHSSRRKAQAIVLTVLCLVVVPLAIYNHGDGENVSKTVYRIAPHVFERQSTPPSSGAPPLSDRSASEGRSSSDVFPTGYVGSVRIAVENRDPVLTHIKLPESVPLLDLAPGGHFDLDGIGNPFGQLSMDTDFGLPDPLPMWSFTSRGLPDGFGDQTALLPTLTRQAHAMLNNPIWPDDVWMVDDTAIVEGWLTMHSYGLISFELISETPPGQGFGAAVQNAVERSQCIPATDSCDNRITIRCRYRCLFFHGGEPTVSVGGAVSARVRR